MQFRKLALLHDPLSHDFCKIFDVEHRRQETVPVQDIRVRAGRRRDS